MANIVLKDIEEVLRGGEKGVIKGLSILVKYEPEEALAAEGVIAILDPAALPAIQAGFDLLGVALTLIKERGTGNTAALTTTLQSEMVKDLSSLLTNSEAALVSLGIVK